MGCAPTQAFVKASRGYQYLLLCRQRGLVTLFEGADLHSRIQSIGRKTGYQIIEYWLPLFGLCSDCK
jgi:Fe2+ or Zn2+ uptake regulation protein